MLGRYLILPEKYIVCSRYCLQIKNVYWKHYTTSQGFLNQTSSASAIIVVGNPPAALLLCCWIFGADQHAICVLVYTRMCMKVYMHMSVLHCVCAISYTCLQGQNRRVDWKRTTESLCHPQSRRTWPSLLPWKWNNCLNQLFHYTDRQSETVWENNTPSHFCYNYKVHYGELSSFINYMHNYIGNKSQTGVCFLTRMGTLLHAHSCIMLHIYIHELIACRYE